MSSLVPALTVAALVFGQWHPIKIEDIKKPVPEWIQEGAAGSVGPRQTMKAEPSECHTYGKEISFSLACAAGSRSRF